MIRYVCPHCQRACESADVLRGFSVICLGCRQPVRVPNESSLPDEAPARSTAPLPPPPAVETRPEAPVTIPPRPTVIVPPLPDVSRKPAPPPIRVQTPAPAGQQRWLVICALLAMLTVACTGGVVVGSRWLSRRRADRKREEAARQLEELKDRTRANFSSAALKRMAAKHPKWEPALADLPRLRGKLVVISMTEDEKRPQSFWERLLATWPLPVQADPTETARDLLARGQLDELTFEIPDYRWAEGIGEADTVIGVVWRKEILGVFQGDRLVEVGEYALPAEQAAAAPRALRWRATVLLLDRASSRVTARREFLGRPPAGKPSGQKREVSGLRPHADVTQWLLRLDAGPGKSAP